MKQKTQWGLRYKDGVVERIKAKESFYRVKGDPKTDKKAAEAEIRLLAAYDERADLVKRDVVVKTFEDGASLTFKSKWEQA